jgi:hypothetical protein
VDSSTGPIGGIEFADLDSNGKVVFYTEASLGLYSIERREVIYSKLLKGQNRVVSIAVNPKEGTLAVLLQNSSSKLTVVIWPTGKIHGGEPAVQFNLKCDNLTVGAQWVEPCVYLPSGNSSQYQLLYAMSPDGMLYGFRFSRQGNKLTLLNEVQFDVRVKMVSTSIGGAWIATADLGMQAVRVWQLLLDVGHDDPVACSPNQLCSLEQSADNLAISQQDAQWSTLVIASEGAASIYVVSREGHYSHIRRFMLPSRNCTIQFVYEDSTNLFVKTDLGFISLYGILEGDQEPHKYNVPASGKTAVAPSRSLFASAEGYHIRLFMHAVERYSC